MLSFHILPCQKKDRKALPFKVMNVNRGDCCCILSIITHLHLSKNSIHPPTCKSSLGHFLPSWWINDFSCKTPVCSGGREASAGQSQPSHVQGGPLICLWRIVFLHLELVFPHRALPCPQPWESLITQDDNTETIKPTYFSKTASVLSLLWAIKISHSSHKPLKHWT